MERKATDASGKLADSTTALMTSHTLTAINRPQTIIPNSKIEKIMCVTGKNQFLITVDK